MHLLKHVAKGISCVIVRDHSSSCPIRLFGQGELWERPRVEACSTRDSSAVKGQVSAGGFVKHCEMVHEGGYRVQRARQHGLVGAYYEAELRDRSSASMTSSI